MVKENHTGHPQPFYNKDQVQSFSNISMKSTEMSCDLSLCSDELGCDEIMNPEETCVTEADWRWSIQNYNGIIC